jgi:predicted regulator of Ras-like GTPase activity (Roadblock/LC7/MglB family)
MANLKDSMDKLQEIDGFIGAAVVDSNSGMMLGSNGGGPINLEVAAAGNTEVVRAKTRVMSQLKLTDSIEDILITLGKQYHLIRPVASKEGLFIYLVLDRAKANLAMGRHRLAEVESTLSV